MLTLAGDWVNLRVTGNSSATVEFGFLDAASLSPSAVPASGPNAFVGQDSLYICGMFMSIHDIFHSQATWST